MRVKFAFLLFISVLLFSLISGPSMSQANAASESTEHEFSERLWVDQTSRGVTRYFSLHREEDRWWLEEYLAREGEFQRFVGRQRFDRLQDAVDDVHKRNPEAIERHAPSSEMSAHSSSLGMAPITEVPGRVIWKVENSWDWSWELRYSEWVRENIKSDFFQKYQIGVDCADVAFSARWIFARINHLPAAASLAATGALFTQDVMLKEWEQLPQAESWNEDQLFIAALKYVLDNTYTHTLMRDSYPISIVKEAFLPGTQHMSLTQDSGHTYLVSAVDLSENSAEPIRVMYSTVPAEARRLSESGFWDARQPVEGQGGFVRFRWPEKSGEKWVLKPANEMMYYSTEQYSPSFMNGFQSFAEAVAIKLNPHLDFKARLENAIDTMIERFRARAAIVEKGEKICATEDCSEGTKNYENWSTPMRDKSLGETLQSLEDYAEQMSERVPGLSQQWYKSLKRPAIQLQGVDYSLGAVAFAWKLGSFSSDPKQPVDIRWGLSSAAFRNSIQTRLKQWLDERAQKIKAQGALCFDLRACEAGSPEWQSSQTFDLDAKIQALTLGSASYCDYSPELECDRYESSLNVESITAGNQTKTLREWMELSPWLNSSPRQSQRKRWGSLKKKYLNHLSQPGDNLQVSKTGWMVSFADGRKTSSNLKNIFRGQEIRSHDGYRFSVLDLEAGLVVAERKATDGSRQIQVMNPDDKTIRLREKISREAALAWILPSRLVLSDNRQIQIFDCSQSPCVKQISQGVARSPQLPDPDHPLIPGLLLVQQASGSYAILDARANPLRVSEFLWKDPEGYDPKHLQLETRDYWVAMAFKKGAEGGMDPRQFFVRKSDGKVIIPNYSAGTEYILHLSQNGRWAVLGQIYEPDGPVSLVELDENLKIVKRVALGSQSISTPASCSDSDSFYFLAQEPQSGARSQMQYYRLTEEGIIRAPLLSDEIEAKSGCRDEMVLTTTTGERLRKWGDSTPLFESAKIEFLTPDSEEKKIRWVISSPMKDFQQSELYDLSSRAAGKPVLTGLLSPIEESDDFYLSQARLGHLISVGPDRMIWLGDGI
jgi:hypothetical protein